MALPQSQQAGVTGSLSIRPNPADKGLIPPCENSERAAAKVVGLVRSSGRSVSQIAKELRDDGEVAQTPRSCRGSPECLVAAWTLGGLPQE